MKSLVIYDSQFGNTEQIAVAIGDALSAHGEAKVLSVAQASPVDPAVHLLVVGSPTQRFHATPRVEQLLRGRPLSNVRAAAFDTRLDMATVDSRVLRMAVKVAGDDSAYAAPRIAAELKKAGATVVVEPQGFYVEDTEGPLRAGELERAGDWARTILAAAGPEREADA